jgi:hypothetical protein
MADYDPFAPQHRGLDDEDLAALGLEDPDEAADSTNDSMTAADEAEPYITAVDPPVVPGGRDGIRVADGFASSDEDAEERTGAPGDDEISERVYGLLRDDAITSNLDLTVTTVDGVVHLRGTVEDIDDALQATEVASRVPGVVDVIDETTVESLNT